MILVNPTLVSTMVCVFLEMVATLSSSVHVFLDLLEKSARVSWMIRSLAIYDCIVVTVIMTVTVVIMNDVVNDDSDENSDDNNDGYDL